MTANIRGRIRKLESKRGTAGRILLAWLWGKSDAEAERAISDLHAGPDDIVLPATWQPGADRRPPAGLEDLNVGERDKLRDAIKAELARRADAVAFSARWSEDASAVKRPRLSQEWPRRAWPLGVVAERANASPGASRGRRVVWAPTSLSLHSIASSARARSVGGMVRPSASAVFKFTISSNFVACSIGRSPGLAPLRSRSTRIAARLNIAGKFTP